METSGEAMTIQLPSFLELQQFVGPNGSGSKVPCPETYALVGTQITNFDHPPSCKCSGSELVLDTEDPLFTALWELCNSQTILDDMDKPRHFHIGIGWATGCSGYVPRSHAEAALLLPDAIYDAGYGVLVSRGDGCSDWHGQVGWVNGRADNWLDALCTTVLAVLKVKEVSDVRNRP